jgi:hypothetical protein
MAGVGGSITVPHGHFNSRIRPGATVGLNGLDPIRPLYEQLNLKLGGAAGFHLAV